MICPKPQHWIRAITIAVILSIQGLVATAETTATERSSTALSPQLQELLRQADCGSAEQATNRYRAAELVQNCLESTSVLTDPLRRLLVELQREITTLNQRVKQLEQRSNELESVRFSTTT